VKEAMDTQDIELKRFLKAHPETEFVDVLLPDLCNIVRGKRVGRKHLEKLYDQGILIPSSTFLLDVNGVGTNAGGRGFSDGDPDVTVQPVAGSLAPVPWAGSGAAQVLGILHELDGEPCPVDPRHVLRRVVSRLADNGLYPVVALELEFYLLDSALADAGEAHPPILPDTGRPAERTQVYSLADLDGVSSFLAEMESVCAAQRVPLGGASSEYAAGQFEINLEHVSDPIAAADHAILLQRAAKGIARKHGVAATFMAKPYPDSAGNGLHTHVSILDDSGRNIFDDGSEQGSERLRQAIAGTLALLPESMAIFAPNLNSFRRFGPNLYVPTGRTWGYNNRSVAVRVPAGAPEARRLEHRMAGADANPYLTLAAILAGIHHGIERQLEPPAARQDNAGAELDSKVPFVWQRALDRVARAEFLPDYLGATYLDLYRECKQFELDAFYKEFTPLEFRWYLAPE